MVCYLRRFDIAGLVYSLAVGVIDLAWAFVEFPDVECTNGPVYTVVGEQSWREGQVRRKSLSLLMLCTIEGPSSVMIRSPISNRCVCETRGWRLVGTGTVVQVVHEAPCLQCVVLGGRELRRIAGCSALSVVSVAGGSICNVVAVRGTTGSMCGAT